MKEAKGLVDWVYLKSGKRKARARACGEYLGLFDEWDDAQWTVDEFLAKRARKDQPTCRDLGAEWLAAREKVVRDIAVDRSMWAAYVVLTCDTALPPRTPSWLDMEPNHVETHHLQMWLDALGERSAKIVRRHKIGPGEWTTELIDTGKPLGLESMKNARSRVKLFFRWLKAKGKRKGENPAEGLIMPVRKRRPRKSNQRIIHLVASEIAALFALPLPIRTRAAYAVFIYAGLRPGEVWGLRWEFVDFKARKFLVRETRTGDPKSVSSLRDVPMLPYAHDMLHAYWASLNPRPLRGLVFPAKHGGFHDKRYTARWDDHAYRRKGEYRVTKGWRSKAGIRPEITVQCFRHTTACQLLQGTVLGNAEPLDLYDVSTWLGHSDISITQKHYAEFSEDSIHNKALGLRRKVETKVETTK